LDFEWRKEGEHRVKHIARAIWKRRWKRVCVPQTKPTEAANPFAACLGNRGDPQQARTALIASRRIQSDFSRDWVEIFVHFKRDSDQDILPRGLGKEGVES